MKAKEFENNEEVISSSDNRVKEYLEKKYGTFKCAGGSSFGLTLESAEEIVRIMKVNNLNSIWGMARFASFKKGKAEYLELVGNKKTFLIEEVEYDNSK